MLDARSASVMVSVLSWSAVPRVIREPSWLERLSGFAWERVMALSEVAPRVVTDSNVSTSVPVTVMALVIALVVTVLMPAPTIVTTP